jgi:hypothetical protein
MWGWHAAEAAQEASAEVVEAEGVDWVAVWGKAGAEVVKDLAQPWVEEA